MGYIQMVFRTLNHEGKTLDYRAAECGNDPVRVIGGRPVHR